MAVQNIVANALHRNAAAQLSAGNQFLTASRNFMIEYRLQTNWLKTQ